jgi:C4-dicarboxylate transporter
MSAIKKGIEKINESQKVITREVKEKTSTYILAALGFVVGLAWNDAIKSLIDLVFPMSKSSIFVKFIYALLVTLIIIAATIILTRQEEKERSGMK